MLLTRCLQTTAKYHSVNYLKSEVWKHLSSSHWVSAQCFPSPLISGTPMSVHGRIEVISAKATYEFKLLLVCTNQLRRFILWGIAKVQSNCGWVMLISCSLTCIFLPGYSHFRCLKAVSAWNVGILGSPPPLCFPFQHDEFWNEVLADLHLFLLLSSDWFIFAFIYFPLVHHNTIRVFFFFTPAVSHSRAP